MVRKKVLFLLEEIFYNNAYSSLLLKKELNAFSVVDRGLITSIVYGTIQNYRYVRYIWEQYTTRKCKDKRIALLLDMSVYQIIFLDKVPSYAIVNDAVDIAREIDDNYVSFVNGVLRSVLRGKNEVIIDDEYEFLGVYYSHPTWLVKMLGKHYGKDKVEAILKANNEVPNICARVNTLKTTKEFLLENYSFTPGTLSCDALYYPKGNLADLDIYKDGYIAIQDESSQMVAYMSKVKDNDRVLDICAAPGSKSMHMAMLMHNTGEIIANDLHLHRCELIEEASERLGVKNIEVKCLDALLNAQVFEDDSFDVVLIDAPCSGLGVLARKCEIRLRANQESIDGIIDIQKQLLELYASKVKNEGYLVYATCTLNKKENEKQIENFLSNHAEFINEEEKTIFPYEFNSDGFYMCRLKKQSVIE